MSNSVADPLHLCESYRQNDTEIDLFSEQNNPDKKTRKRKSQNQFE
jgi:hypothetical protein